MQKKLIGALGISLTLLLSAAQAQANISLETAQACTRYLPAAERLHQIPSYWLTALASQESGRYHEGLRLTLPWPWTINVKGQGYYFDSKQEAMSAIRKYQAQGIKSIDVGCMQVNLYYHGHAFASLDQALDPAYNVAYAAKFLRNNFDETGSWMQATAHYHSQTPARGSDYYRKVYNRWQKVVARINEEFFNTPGGQMQLASLTKPAPYRPSASKHRSSTVRMNSINVAGKAGSVRISNNNVSRENGVLVIRPQKVESKPKAKVVATKPQDKTPAKGQFKPGSFIQVGEVMTTDATAAKFVFQ